MSDKKNKNMLRIAEGFSKRPSVLSGFFNNKIVGIIVELFFLLLGAYGILAELKQGYFEDGELWKNFLIVSFIIIVIYAVIKLNKKLVTMFFAVITVIIIAIYISDIYRAFVSGVYSIAKWIYWYISGGNLAIPVRYRNIGNRLYQFSVLLMALPWAVLNAVSWAKKKGFYGSLLALSIYMTIFFSSGFMPDYLPLFCMLISVCGLAFRNSGVNKEINKKNNIQLLTFAIIGYLALAFTVNYIDNVKSYILPVQDYIYKHYTLDKVMINDDSDPDDKDKDKDKDDIKQAEGGISGGKTGSGDKEFKPKGKDTLKIKFSERINHTIYLKGYVADTYTGSGWINTVSPEQEFYYSANPYKVMSLEYKNLDRVRSNLVAGNSISYPPALPYVILQYTRHVDAEISGISKDSSKGGYVCMPYFGLVDKTDGDIADGFYVKKTSDDPNYFTFIDFDGGFDPNSKNSIYTLAEEYKLDDAFDSYIQMEMKEQEEFAKEHYLDIPDNLYEFKEKFGDVEVSSFKDAVIYVQNQLRDGFKYNTKPGKVPQGEDYIHYFFFDSKEGYCMYYASAAVMIFRSMGIPARYVEGYMITKAAPDINIRIKDNNAHAWVEIFMPNIGWIPVEVTNGRLTANGFVPNETESTPAETKTTQPDNSKPYKETTGNETETESSSNTEDNPGNGVGKTIIVIISIAFGLVIIIVLFQILYVNLIRREKNLAYKKRLRKIYKRIYKLTKRSKSPFTAEGNSSDIASEWKLDEKLVLRLQEILQATEFGNRKHTAEECRFAEKIEKQIIRRKRDNAGCFGRFYYDRLLRIRRK